MCSRAAEKCTAVEILRRISAEVHVFPLRAVMFELYGGALIIRDIKRIQISHMIFIFQVKVCEACTFLEVFNLAVMYFSHAGIVQLQH